MKYTITENKQYKGIEVYFDGKPSEDIRAALKALRFRWHSVKKCWYGSEGCAEAVRRLLSGEWEAPKAEAPKAAKVDRDAIRAEFAKAWKSEKMISFCTDKTAAVAVLPSGEWVTVDKQTIETRFCFGEDGYDYEEAAESAEVARTSESYFKRENMKHFSEWLFDINEARNLDRSRYALVIYVSQYTGQSEDCKLRSIGFKRMSDILDDLGGSAFLADLPGKVIKGYRIATAGDLDAIEAAYKEAATAHEKKVDAYLKRYGLSKVHAWTYWRNA